MNAIVRGWCPSLARPMATGDGLLSRVSPLGGAMTAEQARALATASLRHGNGVLQLTSRAAIQVRGLTAASADRFARDITSVGFTDASRVVRPPLAGDDPGIAPSAAALCDVIERALLGWSPLPKKFAVAVDAGGVLPTGDPGCDVVVRYAGRRWTVVRGHRTRSRASAVGWYAYGGAEAGAFVLGLPFGSVTADDLANLADRIGAGTIRPTPWRAFAITGPAARDAASTPGFIADPDDPRLRVFACPGAPACASASVRARDAAASIAAMRPAYTVHVSGCTKGCAHAGAARVTLVGADGRYDLVRDGRASDTPSLRGLTVAQAIAAVAA